MTKDLFDKYIWLVDTIYRAGKITFEEINERWLRSRLSEGKDLPLRTFHNWRIAIEQVFDIISDSFGIIVEDVDVQDIRVKVHGMQRQYVRALPLHRSQKEVEASDGYSVFAYRMKPSFDFKQELLSWGADVEVLSPAWLRDEMRQAANALAARYAD